MCLNFVKVGRLNFVPSAKKNHFYSLYEWELYIINKAGNNALPPNCLKVNRFP